MKSRITLPLFLLVLVGALSGACSGDSSSDETVGSASAAIALPTLLPVPNGWQGSTVDLMVADALASCAWKDDTNPSEDGSGWDNYLAGVAGFMSTAHCETDPEVPGLFAHWFAQRADPSCNVATGTGAPSAIVLQKHPIPQKAVAGTGGTLGVPGVHGSEWGTNVMNAANQILRFPSVNLCVAAQLRSQAPGTSGGEALLLSASEQRFLLEVTRERTQMAMLGFAQLAVVFTERDLNTLSDQESLPPTAPLPIVMKWGRDPANAAPNGSSPSLLEGMGRDFAAAVQLHTIVSQEIAEMYGRSSSAGEPRGGHASTRAEETWSSGSWRQRSLASLFGGDPLADELDGSAPWTNPAGDHYPSVTTGGFLTPISWPNRWEQPYFTANLSRPEVSSILSLARAYDVQDAKIASVLVDGDCSSIDRLATGQRLYIALEAALRNASCFTQSGGACSTITPGSLPDPNVDYGSFLLWTDHRITPEHAALAADYFADLLEPVCFSADTMHWGSGARDLTDGSIGHPDPATGLDDTWYHLSSDAKFTERSLMSIEPMFGRYTHFAMVPSVLQWANPLQQGFSDPAAFNVNVADESRRLLGSTAALVATREALLVADARLDDAAYEIPAAVKDTFFATKDLILGVIGGAVGNAGVTIRPNLTTTASSALPGAPATVYANHGYSSWRVHVTVRADDSWWQADGTHSLAVVFDDPIAHTLIAHPQTSVLGRSADAVLATSTAGSLASDWTTTTLSENVRSFSGSFSVPSNSGVHHVTLVARRLVSGIQESMVLAANIPVDPLEPAQGYHLSSAGALGAYASRLMRARSGDPSKPAYDGFGYPTNWVPPTDPALLGGTTGEDAARHYLSRAKEASSQATAAVQAAFDSLAQQAADSAQAQAAEKKAGALIQEQVDALCGAGNAGCGTSVSVGPVVDNPIVLQCPPPDPYDDDHVIRCVAQDLIRVAASDFAVADVVRAHIDDPAVPTFASYGGGTLQAMYTKQWGDIRQLKDAVNSVVNAMDSTLSHLDAYVTALAYAQDQIYYQCSSYRMAQAMEAGYSYAEIPGGDTVPTSIGYGPLIAQRERCAETIAGLPSQWAGAVAAYVDSMVALSSYAARVDDAARALAEDGANIQYQVAGVERAKAQARLEVDLANSTLVTSFGIYRRYHSYDLWRAKAAIENARRYAVAARRAIEARYLVDLSEMTAPEAFVAAPASWADQVYDYDLSLPQAVGLSVGTPVADGIYPNKILDYVSNLEAFVEGYAVNRPSASAHGDSEVISLLGPEATISVPQADGFGLETSSQQSAWAYYCDALGQWVGLPTSGSFAGMADQACDGEHPTRARIAFSLDARGRVNANGVQAPPSARYNVRWDALAVNLIGTGVKDCALAADPLTCYSSAFVPYNLSHVGPSWVTDYAGTWRTLGVPLGRIEGAKALAAEQWLDPIANGWSASYVQAVARSEFAERPLDGTYLLDIEVAPEVQLSHLDRIQILTRTSYWVKQQ